VTWLGEFSFIGPLFLWAAFWKLQKLFKRSDENGFGAIFAQTQLATL
jgi:hypothetical protein